MKTEDVLKDCLNALEFRRKMDNLVTWNRTISEGTMSAMERICSERNELIKLLLEGAEPGSPFEDQRERYYRALKRLETLLNREW